MKRFRAHISALYVLSVVFAALGHCWAVSPARAVPASGIHAHNEGDTHRSHGQPDSVSAEGCLGDKATCAIGLSSPALLPALTAVADPAPRSVMLLSPAAPAFAKPSEAPAPRGPPERQMLSADGYAGVFARTGRLLI